MEIDPKKFRVEIDPLTAESLIEKFGSGGLPSLPRPHKIVEDTTCMFLVDNPNTRQLLDAKEKALASLRSTLGLMRILTRDCSIEEPPQIYKDVREAIRILEDDVKLK